MSSAAPLSPDEHENAVREEANAQVEATVAAVDRGLILLGQLRDALEELEPLLTGTFAAITSIPAYDVEVPYDVAGTHLTTAKLGIPESLVVRLRPHREKHLETLAAIDVANAALIRVKRGAYEDRDVAEQAWIAAEEALATLDFHPTTLKCKACAPDEAAAGGDVSPTLTCTCCKPGSPAAVHDPAPPASGEAECCASGSCEVCRGEV